MVRVINNNLWTPVPWGFGCGGHSCGGNNWMQKMFGYQMLFNMMQNIGRCYATPPQQQGGFYPGLYLGGGGGGAAMPQNYEEYLQQQQDAQSLTELKSAYSEFNIRKIGDRYFAYLKSDKTQRIEADSVDELMDGLNEYVDQNPDKFKAKPAKAETSNEETVDNTSTGNDNTTTGTEGAGAPTGNDNTTTGTEGAGAPAASNNSANPNTGVKVPQGWHHNLNKAWIKENFTDKNITTPTAEQIMLAFNGNNTLNINGISPENKAKLLNDLRQYNPSCFNSDGTGKSPFPWKKLDIPGTNVLKNTYGVPEKAKAPAAPAPSSVRTKAADANGTKIAKYTFVEEKGHGDLGHHRLTWNSGAYITTTERTLNQNGVCDSDAIFVLNGKKYNIHSGSNTCDFYSLTSRSTNVFNNYKLIDKNGHFNPNTGYAYYLTDTNGNKAPYGLDTKTVNGKKYFVLICGHNSFSMDDVVAGNIPQDQINANPNNPYAIFRSK